jgi:hypothetical protein
MKTRIMFLRTVDNTPCGCVAISLDRRNHRLNYQYSVQNPIDKFNRKLARQIALGRLIESPIPIPLIRDMEVNMHMISELVMSHLANSNAPKRAIKSAKQWLDDKDFDYDY